MGSQQHTQRAYAQQQDIQIDRQKMKKIQDQEFSNYNLCSLISTLESIYSILQTGESSKPTFQYYDPLKSRQLKKLEELFDQANVQTQLFSTSHMLYVKDHGQYDLPQNLNQDHLKYIINGFAKCPELQPHVQNLIYILHQEYEKVQSFAPNSSSNEFDYETLAKTIPMILCQGQEFGANVQKKYENDPDKYKVLAKINVDSASHPLVKKAQQYDGIDFTSPETVQQSHQVKYSNNFVSTEQIPRSMGLKGQQPMSMEVEQAQQVNNQETTTDVDSEQKIQDPKNSQDFRSQ